MGDRCLASNRVDRLIRRPLASCLTKGLFPFQQGGKHFGKHKHAVLLGRWTESRRFGDKGNRTGSLESLENIPHRSFELSLQCRRGGSTTCSLQLSQHLGAGSPGGSAGIHDLGHELRTAPQRSREHGLETDSDRCGVVTGNPAT